MQQCKTAGVPVFVKQLGKLVIHAQGAESAYGWRLVESLELGDCVYRLKHPKGGDPSEWPEDLRVREVPA